MCIDLLRYLGSARLLAIGGANALVFPVSIVTSVILARLLPKAEYGHLVYFYSGAGLLRLLINLGLGTILSRDVAATWDDHHRLNEVVYSLTLMRVLSVLAIAPLLLLAAGLAPIEFLVPMIVGAICASLADFVFALVAGSRMTWHISAMTVIQPVVYLGVALGTVAIHQVSSPALMLLYALSFLVMTGLGVILIAATGKLRKPMRTDVRPGYITSAVGYAVPSYFASLLSQAWSTVVAGALGLLGQFEHSADFGIAFSIITLSVAIGGPTLLTAFFPQASYLYGSNRHAELLEHIRRTLALFLKGLGWVAILLYSFPDLLVAIFGAKYAPAAPYIAALAPVAVLMGILPLFTLSLIAAGRPWRALGGLLAQLGALFAVLLGLAVITPEQLIVAVLLSTIVGCAVQMGIVMITLKNILISGDGLVTILAAVLLVVLLRLVAVTNLPVVGQMLVALLGSTVYGLVVLFPYVAQRWGAIILKVRDERRA